GLECFPVTGEITYGLERIAMYLQEVNSVYDLVWTYGPDGKAITYGDVFHQNEVEQSTYNFEYADVDFLFTAFNQYEKDCKRLIEAGLPRSEEHTSELQSRENLVCRLLLEKKNYEFL